MMELRKISDTVSYIPNPVNIGVVKVGKKSVILIDTGLDRNVAKKILKLLEKNSLSVKAVINTHSHADHCGGNNYMQKAGAMIYAPEFESAIIQYPLLEPLYLFSGASPLNDLKNKFLMAQPSEINHVIRKDEKELAFDEIELKIIPLAGHAPNQIGFEIDGVLFCADSVFSEVILEKHGIHFNADIDCAKKTLIMLRNTDYDFYVPSHAEPRESVSGLVESNLEVINKVEESLLKILKAEKTTEQVMKELCDEFQIGLNGSQQYYLMNTTVMAYLSSLYNSGNLQVIVKSNILKWKTSS